MYTDLKQFIQCGAVYESVTSGFERGSLYFSVSPELRKVPHDSRPFSDGFR